MRPCPTVRISPWRVAVAALLVAGLRSGSAIADEPCEFSSISVSSIGCGIRADGTMKCWDFPVPFEVQTPGNFVQVSASGLHACAIRQSDSAVECWGWFCTTVYIGPGQFPHTVCNWVTPATGPFVKVSAGGNHDCALRADGSIACWGVNDYGQTTVPPGIYQDVSALGQATCALTIDGEISCWGRDSSTTLVPPPPDATPYTDVATASSAAHICAMHDGSAVCWGSNSSGQTSAPAGAFEQLSAFGATTCGLRPDGSAECWGSNVNNDATPTTSVFTQVSRDCGLLADGTMECWGRSAATLCSVCSNGQTGTGEECDDGNTVNGDGCDYNCTVTACGNGVVTSATGEVCDDGNDVNADGCDNDCTPGTVVCGDGIKAASEECDDGNTIDGDGCDDCTIPDCGNGSLDVFVGIEECDDGNVVDGDGCSAECMIECPATAASAEYTCTEAPRASLAIKDSDNDGSDGLSWQWKNGAAENADFYSVRFNLCLYRDQGVLSESVLLDAPEESFVQKNESWTYTDREAAVGGIKSLKFRWNSNGATSIRLKAKGVALPDDLVPATSYTLKLIDPNVGTCWESTFATGTSTDTGFKAKFEAE